MTDARLTVVVLTEDTAKDAHATMESILRATLRLLAPGARLDLVRFEPAQEHAHRAVRANHWKSAKAEHHRAKIDLLNTIATDVLRSNCVVTFHFDGDRPWACRDDAENVEKFRSVVVHGVRQRLVAHQLPEERIERALRRLVAVVPFYTLEAWLYQNAKRATELCHTHHRGEHVDRYAEWERDREQLDEIERPWSVACLGKDHNVDLAQNGFPASLVASVGKSYASAVAALRANTDMMAVLESLRSA